MRRFVVLISGRGSNLGATIEQRKQHNWPHALVGVITDRADAEGLGLAKSAGIATCVIERDKFASDQSFEDAMVKQIDAWCADLIVLAGFMVILRAGFIRHYRGRIVNIHPSLLPRFKGLNTHQRAIDAAATEHGATVHWVNESLDGGEMIRQDSLQVQASDNATTLAARVLAIEHRMYPTVIREVLDSL